MKRGGERMNRVFPFIFIFLLILSCDYFKKKKDLAVLNIQKGEHVPAEIDTMLLRNVVMDEAERVSNYRVLREENVMSILREKGIEINKCGEYEDAIEFMRCLGASKGIVGRIYFSDRIYYITLTLYDVASASIEKSITKGCEACSFPILLEIARLSASELFKEGPPPEKVEIVRAEDRAEELFYLIRGEINYYDGKYDLAIKEYTELVGINPRSYEGYRLRGIAYYNIGEYDLAIKDLMRAIELNPGYSDAMAILGLVYEEGKKDKKNAEYWYKKALENQFTSIGIETIVKKLLKNLQGK
jgi:tetratricopeptide (TPR) repeat protein